MNIITTCVVTPAADSYVDVVWVMGMARQGKQGRIRVALAADVPDRTVIAELAAMHYLLVVRAVLSEDRAGNALDLRVSSGAIKKLAQRRSTKAHLVPYANFLAVRFADANIEVQQKATWLKPRAENDVVELTLTSDALDDELELRPFGRVALTRHAIDQFALRSNRPEDYSECWRAIRLILSNRLEEVVQSDDARREKLERHGVDGRVFYHRDSHWNFVVGEAPGQGNTPRILTAYYTRR